MKRLLSIVILFFPYAHIFGFTYRPEIDGEGGFFIVTGKEAIEGIIYLLMCAAITAICFGICSIIEKKKGEPDKGFLKIIYYTLMSIGTISSIGTICFAFAMWWFTLIIAVIALIIALIYHKIKGDL